jgi:hypothetical protein
MIKLEGKRPVNAGKEGEAMRRPFFISVAALAFLGVVMMALAGENPVQVSKESLYRVEMAIEGQNLKVGANRAVLVILDREGKPVTGALVRVLPLVHRHGETALMRPRVTEKDPGHYQVENIYIEMEGHWVLKVSMKIGSAEEEVVFDFPGVKRVP